MTSRFRELVIGDVLVAPFVTYLVLAGAIVVLLRPLLILARFERMFSNPSLALLGLFVVVLAALMSML